MRSHHFAPEDIQAVARSASSAPLLRGMLLMRSPWAACGVLSTGLVGPSSRSANRTAPTSTPWWGHLQRPAQFPCGFLKLGPFVSLRIFCVLRSTIYVALPSVCCLIRGVDCERVSTPLFIRHVRQLESLPIARRFARTS